LNPLPPGRAAHVAGDRLTEGPELGPRLPPLRGLAPGLAPLRGRLSGALVAFLRLLLRGYRITLSPLFGPSCRFVPTCSCYADEALETWGVWRGIGLSAWRILRCHPFSRGGLDPVPPPPPPGVDHFGSESHQPGMKLVGDSER
jgi:uncharacterized protein